MQNAGAVIREAALVASAGLVFALGANALSPRGIALRSSVRHESVLSAGTTVGGVRPISGDDPALVATDLRAAAGVVLIDARSDDAYAQGHIPGALQLDPYRAGRHLAQVLPVCLSARLVVVYCNGTACADSLAAAGILREAGVPADTLRVYAGGISDWKGRGRPVQR